MCCSGTVGGEWRMTEKVRERREVLFRDCGWGVEDDRESEGEKGCVVETPVVKPQCVAGLCAC